MPDMHETSMWVELLPWIPPDILLYVLYQTISQRSIRKFSLCIDFSRNFFVNFFRNFWSYCIENVFKYSFNYLKISLQNPSKKIPWNYSSDFSNNLPKHSSKFLQLFSKISSETSPNILSMILRKNLSRIYLGNSSEFFSGIL